MASVAIMTNRSASTMTGREASTSVLESVSQSIPETLRLILDDSFSTWRQDFKSILHDCMAHQQQSLDNLVSQHQRLEHAIVSQGDFRATGTPSRSFSPRSHNACAPHLSERSVASTHRSSIPGVLLSDVELQVSSIAKSSQVSSIAKSSFRSSMLTSPTKPRNDERASVSVTTESGKKKEARTPAPGVLTIGAVTNDTAREQPMTPSAPNKTRFSQEQADSKSQAKQFCSQGSWDGSDIIHKVSSRKSDTNDLQGIRRARKHVENFLGSTEVGIGMTLLIVCHAILMGVQVDHPELKGGFVVVDIVFAGIFSAELVLRIFAERKRFLKKNRAWNLFDGAVVVISAVEVAMTIDGKSESGVAVVRLLRVARIAKVLRVFRLVRSFKALRIMVLSIFGTMKSLFWAILLMTMILYVFGLVFVQCARDQLAQSSQKSLDDKTQRELQLYYGDLLSAMFTLFKSVVGGEDWGRTVDPLSRVSHLYTGLFIAFVIVMTFAVMNVVTGYFCHKAIESADQDHEHVLCEQISDQKRYTRHLKQIFTSLESNSDRITLEDFENSLADEQLMAFFRMLDIHITDAWSIFRLLDADGSQDVDLDEFVQGCLRLRGMAKSVDMANAIFRIDWLSNRFVEFVEYAEQEFRGMERAVRGSRGVVHEPLRRIESEPDELATILNESKVSLLGEAVRNMSL